MIGPLAGEHLLPRYRDGSLRPVDVVAEVYDRIAARGDDAVWIHVVPRAEALAAAQDLEARAGGRDLPPLYGLPFAVKDNVDVAGLPTTAACPEFAYVATATAPVVQRALEAGAVLVGKTNLDQFATGLSGTRSPYGIVRNPFDPDVISGGSSSGSAVAVAAGLVTFAVGTDTAGSGRVPAALTGTVGVKPSRGLVSTRGIVPACRSLDCASVFAADVADGARVLAAVAGRDPQDPWSRALPVPPAAPVGLDVADLRVAVPAADDLDFEGDGEAEAAFRVARDRLAAAGARLVEVALAPFRDAGDLLYDGPWVAERTAALEGFLTRRPEAVHPVTAAVLARAGSVSGPDVFRGLHALQEARLRADRTWAVADVLLLPTVPTAPTVARLLADPLGANAMLGRYTHFGNLLDLAALAVPSGVTAAGVPTGVTFFAPAGEDTLLLAVGAAWEAVRPHAVAV